VIDKSPVKVTRSKKFGPITANPVLIPRLRQRTGTERGNPAGQHCPNQSKILNSNFKTGAINHSTTPPGASLCLSTEPPVVMLRLQYGILLPLVFDECKKRPLANLPNILKTLLGVVLAPRFSSEIFTIFTKLQLFIVCNCLV